jgi:hypothetical protein
MKNLIWEGAQWVKRKGHEWKGKKESLLAEYASAYTLPAKLSVCSELLRHASKGLGTGLEEEANEMIVSMLRIFRKMSMELGADYEQKFKDDIMQGMFDDEFAKIKEAEKAQSEWYEEIGSYDPVLKKAVIEEHNKELKEISQTFAELEKEVDEELVEEKRKLLERFVEVLNEYRGEERIANRLNQLADVLAVIRSNMLFLKLNENRRLLYWLHLELRKLGEGCRKIEQNERERKVRKRRQRK